MTIPRFVLTYLDNEIINRLPNESLGPLAIASGIPAKIIWLGRQAPCCERFRPITLIISPTQVTMYNATSHVRCSIFSYGDQNNNYRKIDVPEATINANMHRLVALCGIAVTLSMFEYTCDSLAHIIHDCFISIKQSHNYSCANEVPHDGYQTVTKLSSANRVQISLALDFTRSIRTEYGQTLNPCHYNGIHLFHCLILFMHKYLHISQYLII